MTWWGSEQVTFVHSSVFQFFTTNLPSWVVKEDPWRILSDKKAMHSQNALDCLAYICLRIDALRSDKPIEEQINYDAWCFYAINYFDRHIVASGEAVNPNSSLTTYLRQIIGRDEDFLSKFLTIRNFLPKSIGKPAKPVAYFLCGIVGPVRPGHILWSTRLHTIEGGLMTTSWPPPDYTLHMLSLNGNFEELQSFMDVAAKMGNLDINEEDGFGYSALYYACSLGFAPIVEMLLRNGACPQQGSASPSCFDEFPDRDSPLCTAIREDHLPVVELLLGAGVNTNILMCDWGYRHYPLQVASESKLPAIIDLLVAYGADDRLLSRGKAVVEVDHAVGGAGEY
jgi:hypothetical protein